MLFSGHGYPLLLPGLRKHLQAPHLLFYARRRVELPKLCDSLELGTHVVLNTAFGQETMAVDTHIFRVTNRTNIAPGKTVLEVEKKLLKNVPKEFLKDAHHWLILHGRYTCLARKPRCGSCVIYDLCEYKNKTED